MDPDPLPRTYYLGDPEAMARDMLGKLLCARGPEGVRRYRVAETEAYCGESDTACHASRGRTPRTSLMYEAGGRAYVYRCHMWDILTVTVGPEGEPGGVLIRAVEGIDGPGRVGRELGLKLDMFGSPMDGSSFLWMEDDGARPGYSEHPRVGIGYASPEDRARLLRFRADGS